MRGIKLPLSIMLKGHSKTACLSQNFPVTNIASDRKMLCTGNPSPLLLHCWFWLRPLLQQEIKIILLRKEANEFPLPQMPLDTSWIKEKHINIKNDDMQVTRSTACCMIKTTYSFWIEKEYRVSCSNATPLHCLIMCSWVHCLLCSPVTPQQWCSHHFLWENIPSYEPAPCKECFPCDCLRVTLFTCFITLTLGLLNRNAHLSFYCLVYFVHVRCSLSWGISQLGKYQKPDK